MAIAIKSIPVLKDKAAERFIKQADENVKLKETIEFSEQVKIAEKILEKAKK